MDNKIYLLFVITILTIFYLYKFYRENKNVIIEIKYGRILFAISAAMVVLLGSIIILNRINDYTIFYVLPFLIVSFWFSYKFYKTKNSLYDYLYLIATTVFSLVILYYLYWNDNVT
jgi:hypothetical protein